MKYFYIKKSWIIILIIVLYSSLKSEAQWQQLNGPKDVCILSFAIKDTLIYAGAGEGLYVSSNKGNNWTLTNNDLFSYYTSLGDNPSISSIEFVGNTLLVGTFEEGIFRSTDNGDHWDTARIGLPFFNLFGISYIRVRDITQAGQYVMAGTDAGVFLSSDTGTTWFSANGISSMLIYQFTIKGSNIYAATNNGIYYSIDNGLNWASYNNLPSLNVTNITSNSTSIFVVSDSITYRSNDNGLSWQALNSGTKYEIYSMTCDGNNIYVGTYSYGLLYSPDNGVSWTFRNNNLSQLPIMSILVNGTDIYAGGYSGVYYSNNNGLFWENRNIGFAINYFSTAFKFVFQNNSIVSLCQFGLFRSIDDGNSWSPINNGFHDIINNPFYDVVSFGDTLITAVGHQGVFFSFDNGFTWNARNNGISCSGVRNIAVGGSNIYLVTDSCGLYRSSDFGLNWVSINSGLPSYYNVLCLDASDSLLFYSYNDGSIIYKSTNKGNSWTAISEPEPIYHIDIDSNVVFLIGNALKISTDYGQTWMSYTNGLQAVNYNYYNGVSNGHDFFIGSEENGVYKLKNNIWVPISAGFPVGANHNVYGLEINDSTLYTGVQYCGNWKRNISNLNFNSYKGTVFNDLDNDGTMDIGEIGLSNIMVKLKTSNYYFLSDSIGEYTAYADYDPDTLEAISPSVYSNISPSYYIVANSDTIKNFGIHFISGVNDLQISCTEYTPAIPGFDDEFRITYKNIGTETISGQVKFVFNNNLGLITSSPIYNSLSNDTLVWNFTNLLPFETRNIDVTFNIPSSLNIGDTLNFISIIMPIVTDTVPGDNIYTLSQIVVGSFDPNAKNVSPEGNISPSQILNGERLVYTIHFQNTGTYAAFNIKIVDTLSQNLDISSFEVISASHPYTWNIKESGIIEFIFSNILLPDSGANQLLSNGFIKYSIKPKNLLQCGDLINNTAHIYFDFNIPISTNTTQTMVQWPLGINSINNNITSIAMFPNPTTNKINLSWSIKEKPLISIFNISGQLLYQEQSKNGNSMTIDVSGFNKGLYMVKVIGEDFVETRKLVIK